MLRGERSHQAQVSCMQADILRRILTSNRVYCTSTCAHWCTQTNISAVF